MSVQTIEPRGETIGIVFPVYYSDAPIIVRDFTKRLKNLATKYVFVVCTYGGGPGDSIATLGKIIAKGGGRLSAAFGVHMPQNAFKKPWEIHEKVYRHAAEKCITISTRVLLKKQGMFLSDILLYLVLRICQTINEQIISAGVSGGSCSSNPRGSGDVASRSLT